MSDAITDIDRENEKESLAKININKAVIKLQVLYSKHKEYKKLKSDIIERGYVVKELESKIQVFKQIN